ncbi:hypothetical protein VNO80_08578 [Phaseolus coccineus]|uniref:Uncharacterized protein n=1 Tax=Phaseolus coccineus TaxID=3886 RepID=A0AAN9N4L8_PHACN
MLILLYYHYHLHFYFMAGSVSTWHILNLTEQKEGGQLHVTVIPALLVLHLRPISILSLSSLFLNSLLLLCLLDQTKLPNDRLESLQFLVQHKLMVVVPLFFVHT